ncbi:MULTISPECIES: sunset domain-containing protein [unclassified Luteococcus]|uniref:sunset domain-containing protein n=1 Tax=unclassified Luteococcus TaxID=2639923 RepID=UPI00313C5CAE
MTRKPKHEAAAEDRTAVDRAVQLVEQVLGVTNPVLGQAVKAADHARRNAGEHVAPLAEQAKHTAATKVAPLAATAVAVGAAKKEQLQPHLDTVAEKVQPAAEQARAKVQEDLVPQLMELLHQAENHPAVSEASKRSAAAKAALKGELELPEKKKRSVGGTVAKVAAAGTLLAAVTVAVRQFLASKDDAWTAHQPSTAYVAEEPSADEAMDRAETEPGQPAQRDVESEPNPHEQMSAEGGPVNGAETVAEDINVLNEYGEGAYVGEEPPSGFDIKGNERSMKFHTSDSAGYERTIADVWFNSVEAAEKACFTRAQR